MPSLEVLEFPALVPKPRENHLTSLRSLAACILLFTFTNLALAQSPTEPNHMQAVSTPLLGYTEQASTTERDLEKKFQDGILPDNIRENMRRLSARPHHVGSPYDKDNAEWILARFKEWGFDAHIETFDVLFPTPKERLLELVEPHAVPRQAARNPLSPSIPLPIRPAEQLPTYNAYSIDGDVTGDLVYVNYGNREDYEAARPDGSLRQGKDRDLRVMAVRLAGHQAESRRRARGHRLHHLLRSQGRRLTISGDDYPRGRCVRAMACSAAA